MKYRLSYQIQKFIFDKEFFENIYIENPDLIRKDPSLLFKSISVGNTTAFSWLLKKVDIEPVFETLFNFIYRNKRFLAYYFVIKKSYPEIFDKIENQIMIFKSFYKSIFWKDNKKEIARKLKIATDIANKYNLIDSFMLDELIKKKDLHKLVIDCIKSGIEPIHKDNLFAVFCANGSPEHVSFFKDIGCDVHYMNDLALINAAEEKNESMVRYLIEKEGANPCVGNNFPFFALFSKDETDEKDNISDDLVIFLAKNAYSAPRFSKVALKKLLKNKKFSTTYQYLVINESLKKKNEFTSSKIKPNKI